jgi:4'-phosphopantetheinyl transferase EntD
MIAVFKAVWPSVENWNRFPERPLASKKDIGM